MMWLDQPGRCACFRGVVLRRHIPSVEHSENVHTVAGVERYGGGLTTDVRAQARIGEDVEHQLEIVKGGDRIARWEMCDGRRYRMKAKTARAGANQSGGRSLAMTATALRMTSVKTEMRCAQYGRQLMGRAATLVVALLAASSLALAAEVPVFSATVHGVATAMGPVTDGKDGKVPLTIRIRDDATRIDFTGPRGEEAYLLAVAGGEQRWLVHRATGMALPIPGTATPLRVDPADPCAMMRARCERGEGEVIAGTVVQGWRYRHAGGRGPDGTERGTLWIDPASGLVLGYRGQLAGQSGQREMRALSVSRQPLDPGQFDLPRTPQANSTAPDSAVD